MTPPIYIVQSPPRSGTSSLHKMAEIVGLKPKHESFNKFQDPVSGGYNFFSDTPFYDPGYLFALLQNYPNLKVIYSARNVAALKRSIKQVVHNYENHTPSVTDRLNPGEACYIACYGRLHVDSLIDSHKDTITELCRAFNVPMLEYQFDMGWKPFCDFVGKPIPDREIPCINKNGEIHELSKSPTQI